MGILFIIFGKTFTIFKQRRPATRCYIIAGLIFVVGISLKIIWWLYG